MILLIAAAPGALSAQDGVLPPEKPNPPKAPDEPGLPVAPNEPFDGATRWKKPFEVAAKRAMARKVPLLVSFTGHKWCKSSGHLEKKLLHTPNFVKWAETEFEIVNVPIDRPKNFKKFELKKGKKEGFQVHGSYSTNIFSNHPLMRQYGVNHLPTLVVIEPGGMKVGRIAYSPKIKLEDVAVKVKYYLASYKKIAELRAALKGSEGLQRARVLDKMARYYWDRENSGYAYKYSQNYLQNDPNNDVGEVSYHAVRVAMFHYSYNQVKQGNEYAKLVEKYDPRNKSGNLERLQFARVALATKHRNIKLALKQLEAMDVEQITNKGYYHWNKGYLNFLRGNLETARDSLDQAVKIGGNTKSHKMASFYLEIVKEKILEMEKKKNGVEEAPEGWSED